MATDPIQFFCNSTGASTQDVLAGFGYGMSVNALNTDGEQLVYGASFSNPSAPNSIMVGGNNNALFNGYNLGKTSGSVFGGGGFNIANTSGMASGGYNLSGSVHVFVPVGTLDIYNQGGIDPNSNPHKIDLSKATEAITTNNQAASGNSNKASSAQTQGKGKKLSYVYHGGTSVTYHDETGKTYTVQEAMRYDPEVYHAAQKAIRDGKKS